MTDREVVRAAEFLAEHALLLLGLAVAASLLALAAVIGAVHLLRRHRETIRRRFTASMQWLRRLDGFERVIARSRVFVPSSYLTLHLGLGLLGTAAVAVFAVIAQEVIGRGEVVAFDLAFAQALRDAATPGWERFFTVVSWLGQGWMLGVLTVAIGIRLAITHDRLTAWGWVTAQLGGGVLNVALKETFERTRPSFADPSLAASSWSFPSGHAMGTFILCGLGCYVLLRNRRSWPLAAIVVTAALAWCIVMAFSRLYLGVHFASDVVAGVVAGAAWVAVCASAFEIVRRRRG